MKAKKGTTAIDLSTLLEKIHGSVYCKDIDGVYLGCNQYMVRMAGFSSSKEIIGKTDYDMPWRDQADVLRVIDQSVLDSGEIKTLEETVKLANGKWATYLTTKEPLRDESGEIIGLYGLSVDITKYKQLENKLLQESKPKDVFSNLNQIVACMPGSVYWKDKEGIYRGCNGELLAALGFSSMDEIIGKSDHDLAKILGLDIHVVESFCRVDREVITSGRSRLNFEELPFHFGGGKIVHQLSNKVPLRDENNMVIGLVGISIDISERKKQEADFLEQVFACMPGSVYWKDVDGIYRGCNDELANLMEVPKSEIMGKTDYDLIKKLNLPSSLAESVIQLDQAIMASGIPRLNHEELPFHFANGKTINQLTNKVPLRDKTGQVIGVVGVSIDITDRKKAEESLLKAKEAAEAASQAKSAFLDNMRHDLRTPLTGIVGFAQLIKDETSDPCVKEYADNLVSSAESLLEFLNEILEAIRLTSGDVTIQKKKFNLREKLQSVVNLNLAKANEKKIALSLDYDATIPQYLVGDSRRIQRIVLELVSNALKFTHQGTVKISTKIEKSNAGEPIVKIVVTDTGVGIPESEREKIFGSFNRLHGSYEGVFHGIGLGLAIVKQFVDDLNGEIYVESAFDKGSMFICILPLKAALVQDDSHVEKSTDIVWKDYSPAKIIISSTDAATNAPNTDPKAIKILVVEDNEIAIKVVTSILEQLGCAVDVAKNGCSAVDLAKLNTYDLVFMDVGLPDMNGNEVTMAIRDWENQFEQHTPIIGLTAHVEAEDKQECVRAGMDAVLSKPLKVEMAKDILTAFIPKFSPEKKAASPAKTNLTQFGLPENEQELFHLPDQFINLDIIAQAFGKAKNMAREILPAMSADVLLESEKIKTAYHQGNWQLVQELAHKMKGGASCCGTVRLEKACMYLERYLKAGHTDLKEELYQQLLKEMQATVAAIAEWMKNNA